MEDFINIKNIVNFNFLVCYKKLFNKEGFINNIGCYIMLGIFLFHIITIFSFNIKIFPLIKKRIEFIVTNLVKTIMNKNAKKKDGFEKHKFEIDRI